VRRLLEKLNGKRKPRPASTLKIVAGSNGAAPRAPVAAATKPAVRSTGQPSRPPAPAAPKKDLLSRVLGFD